MALTALIPRLLSPSPSFPVCGKGGKISDFSTLSTVSSVSVAFELAKLHFLCQVTHIFFQSRKKRPANHITIGNNGVL